MSDFLEYLPSLLLALLAIVTFVVQQRDKTRKEKKNLASQSDENLLDFIKVLRAQLADNGVTITKIQERYQDLYNRFLNLQDAYLELRNRTSPQGIESPNATYLPANPEHSSTYEHPQET